MSSLIHFYKSIDINFTQGDGCYIWDDVGYKYLDMMAGVGVKTSIFMIKIHQNKFSLI